MKTIIMYIVLSVLFLMNPLKMSSQFYESFTEDWPLSGSEAHTFVWQSDMFYQQEMNRYSYFVDNPFFTINKNELLRTLGDAEMMDTGGNTSGNDHLHFANDVPLGDGVFPLLLAVLGYIIYWQKVKRQMSNK